MAVYTEVPDHALKAFLADYDVGQVVSFKGIAEGVENSNYVLKTDRDTYILTLYEKRVERADLPFFIGLMEHLAKRGISCPQPVADRQGLVLKELCGRAAVIITFLEGLWPRRVHNWHCGALGETLAALHAAVADFPLKRANALSLAGWQRLVAATHARADEVSPGLASWLSNELSHLAAHWPLGLPSGVIHADLFPDNVFFLGERLSGVIDFYFACNDSFAYDLSICLNAWCFEPDGQFNITKAKLLVEAYDKKRRLSAAELAALPLLARGSALRFLLTRLYDWLNHPPGAFVQPKDPMEYVRKLRFHQSVAGVGAYGL